MKAEDDDAEAEDDGIDVARLNAWKQRMTAPEQRMMARMAEVDGAKDEG